MARLHRLLLATLAAALLLVSSGATASAALRHVVPARDLGCAVANPADDFLTFGTDGCGTVLAIRGGPEYAPRNLAGETHTVGARHVRLFRPLRRRHIAGAAVTTVRAGPVDLVETDRAAGNALTTRVLVLNRSARARTVTVYRVGICFDGDQGYPVAGRTAAGCVPGVQDGRLAREVPGVPIIRLAGLGGRAGLYAGDDARLLARVGAGRSLSGAPNGAFGVGTGLSWRLRLPAHGAAVATSRIRLSAGGARARPRLRAVPATHRLVAVLRGHGRPLAGRRLRFDVAQARYCTARTNASGRASCRWRRRSARPRFAVAFRGGIGLRPVRARASGPPAPLPPRGPHFRACARFDTDGPGSVEPDPVLHDRFATFELQAPSCPAVDYQLLARHRHRLVLLGHLPGDGSGHGASGFAALFTQKPLGPDFRCFKARTVDRRTGRPLALSPTCLPLVLSQKFH